MSAPSTGLRYGFWQDPDNGSMHKRLVRASNYYTFESARAALDAMPDGLAKTEARERLAAAEQNTYGAVQGAALRWAMETEEGVSAAEAATGQHVAHVTDLIARLRSGSVTATEAAEAYDRVIRAQRAIEGELNAWRAGVENAVRRYQDPLAEHDRLVNTYSTLRAGRPVVAF